MLTERQAYEAMIAFVEQFYEETKWEGVGQLLSEIEFTMGDNTGDPGSLHDWGKAVDKVLGQSA
jgi:hypothetical protein